MDRSPVDCRNEAEALFAIEVALAELVAVTETQSLNLIARIEQLETTTMTKLTDIETKLDQLDTMLSAKAASDDADLTAVADKLDGIIAKHATPAVPDTSADVSLTGSVGTIGTLVTE